MALIFTDLFLRTDNPSTCPICGARTDLIADLNHTNLKVDVQKCLDAKCEFEFLETE